MWIFTPNSFISVVQKPGDTDMLTVRARVKGDIERLFPKARVVANAGTDYAYRAKVHRGEVAQAMFDSVMDIDFSNFKNEVKEDHRHDAYMGVWSTMMRYQTQRAGKRKTRGQSEMAY